jgi:hypothetical protein
MQMANLQTVMSSSPSPLGLEEISLTGSINHKKLPSLLQAIERARCRKIDVDSWGLASFYQDSLAVPTYMSLHMVEELHLNYTLLSTSDWSSLLQNLDIPNLKKLEIIGDASLHAVTRFLSCCNLHSPTSPDGLQMDSTRTPDGLQMDSTRTPDGLQCSVFCDRLSVFLTFVPCVPLLSHLGSQRGCRYEGWGYLW